MRTHKTAQPFLLAVFFAASAAADPGAPALSAPTAAPIVAPTEYDWTFFYRGTRYGLQQFGPVAIYPRNAHIIWRSRAYRIPVTVPWALVIAACIVFAPAGFIVLGKKGRGD